MGLDSGAKKKFLTRPPPCCGCLDQGSCQHCSHRLHSGGRAGQRVPGGQLGADSWALLCPAALFCRGNEGPLSARNPGAAPGVQGVNTRGQLLLQDCGEGRAVTGCSGPSSAASGRDRTRPSWNETSYSSLSPLTSGPAPSLLPSLPGRGSAGWGRVW